MKQELKKEILNTFRELNKSIALFKEEDINAVPFEGSWTPGQVVEHTIKSISNLPTFFAEAVPTQRDPGENIPGIKRTFLDFTIKMQSPDFIVPSGWDHDKENLSAELIRLEKQMLDAVENLDLSLTCTSFEFPGSGFLTRLEWISFFIAHTQRHTHQLKNIYQTLKN